MNVRVDSGNAIKDTENPKTRGFHKIRNLTEEQKMAISQISSKMSNKCKALMRHIVCFSTENWSVDTLLASWVKSTNPERADWLSILKELERLSHPLHFEVFEHAFTEESFEPNIRDYTKIIHTYAKQNMLREAENALTAMKNRGFVCDQVTLTALVHMYSKAGNLKLAEESFEEMKLLGVPLDRRSYGSIIMAYIRAEKFDLGERVLKEMEGQDIYAGREVYKALLRAYSMMGDSLGAQRVFDAIQLAGIVPDARVCGLLINAYFVAGLNREACVAFENMRKSGLKPNDKCVALVLAAYEKESRLNEALNLLVELERNGYVLGKECSDFLLNWFRKLGVVDEVEVIQCATSLVMMFFKNFTGLSNLTGPGSLGL
ncbi:pentatricopeptide repeat-containing protein at1g01970 [Phtheirospermum japonicum]|uniref:Pentatricopeptide repeat-containing protein at1g01970 n=1 Tax=Phtheirospermum japonicum TaxID=374723 RepID=A0A830BUQ1_9LAMI|nr:pentatricopeptide repeat-containing protein at1g01970 [Phtheirospermum japonicum]